MFFKNVKLMLFAACLGALFSCAKFAAKTDGAGESPKEPAAPGTFAIDQPLDGKVDEPVEISWEELASAKKYQLTIGTDAKCEIAYRAATTKETNEEVTFSESGKYFVCVTAIMPDDTEVAASNSGLKISIERDPPIHGAVSLSFTDTDAVGGEIAGAVTIFKAATESDVSNYVLYWGSSATAKLQNTSIATIEKTGSNLTYTFSTATLIPVGATHFLVFTENEGGQMETGTSLLIIDSGVPTNAAVSMAFTDSDVDGGELTGTVNITMAVDESDFSDYVLYWGSSSTTKQSATPIATVAKTGANLTYNIAANTALPGGATHLLVFTKNAGGEMATGVNVAIVDLGVPIHAAASVAFTDTDLDGGDLAGVVTITKAANESDITDYVLYWGSNTTTKQSATPIATIPKTGANVTYTFGANTAKPGAATHLLVRTVNADGEMATGVNVAIVDLGVPIHAAVSVTFTDSDLDGGQLTGTVTITKAANESDVTDYVLYWGSSSTVKNSATPIATLPKSGGNVTHAFLANTAKLAGSTHLLVFTKNADGEMATGVNVAITDLGVPIHAAASVTFTDTDLDGSQIAGNILITKAAVETDITHYVIYWGSNSTTKDSGTPIATILNQGFATYNTIVPTNTAKPVTSTHFLVFTKNADGEMATGVNVAIGDKAVPANKPGGIAFVDGDADGGEIAGNVTITKAADESDVTDYVLYWGVTADTKSATVIATLPKTGANLTHSIPANTVIPSGGFGEPAYFLIVFTKNADGEQGAAPGVSVRITDVGGSAPMGACMANDASFTSNLTTCKDLVTNLSWSRVLGTTNLAQVNCGYAGGFSDWRRPTTNELVAVAQHGGSAHITGSAGQVFWGDDYGTDADVITMDTGGWTSCYDQLILLSNCYEDEPYQTICVR